MRVNRVHEGVHHRGCISLWTLFCWFHTGGQHMITVNGVKRTLEQPLSVTEYLEKNQYVPVQFYIELNDQILAR